MESLARNKIMAAYEEDYDGIQMYDSAVSAVVMIPTEDQQLQYYMSRTKTGMDNMVIHAQEQLTGSAELMEQIGYNSYLMKKLKAGKIDRTKNEKADAMIHELGEALEQIASDIRAVDSEYLSTKGRNYIGFSEDRTSLAEQIGLLSSVLAAALILIAAYFCVFLRLFIADKEVEA